MERAEETPARVGRRAPALMSDDRGEEAVEWCILLGVLAGLVILLVIVVGGLFRLWSWTAAELTGQAASQAVTTEEAGDSRGR